MKFKRKFTDITRKVVNTALWTSIALTALVFISIVFKECTYINERATDCKILGIDELAIMPMLGSITLISYIILLLAHICNIVVTGLEKPKFISTAAETHNKKRNEMDGSDEPPIR